MDLTHSKTMESEVYNIPDSKSTDMIQPPPRHLEGQTEATNGAVKGKRTRYLIAQNCTRTEIHECPSLPIYVFLQEQNFASIHGDGWCWGSSACTRRPIPCSGSSTVSSPTLYKSEWLSDGLSGVLYVVAMEICSESRVGILWRICGIFCCFCCCCHAYSDSHNPWRLMCATHFNLTAFHAIIRHIGYWDNKNPSHSGG